MQLLPFLQSHFALLLGVWVRGTAGGGRRDRARESGSTKRTKTNTRRRCVKMVLVSAAGLGNAHAHATPLMPDCPSFLESLLEQKNIVGGCVENASLWPLPLPLGPIPSPPSPLPICPLPSPLTASPPNLPLPKKQYSNKDLRTPRRQMACPQSRGHAARTPQRFPCERGLQGGPSWREDGVIEIEPLRLRVRMPLSKVGGPVGGWTGRWEGDALWAEASPSLGNPPARAPQS